ncbi:MAG: CopG family antitoxin, partial [Dehalococcoidia bacterium]|nr:CopG family antitoxin [Dehalococcoidia bacterium]
EPIAMTTPREAHKQIPEFRSVEEEADFWESHSPLDYPDEWTEAKQTRVQRPLGHVLGVRLDAKTLDKLAGIGRNKGIGPSTLARIWIMERLMEEPEAGQELPARDARRRAAAR